MTTAAVPQTAARETTVADLATKFGSLPARRVRTDVAPGTATEEDVERLCREQDVLCELIDGVLVEKASSECTSFLAVEICAELINFVRPRKLGWILGVNSFTRLFGTRLRAPDVSFVRPGQRPHGLLFRGYADGAPALAVEVFSTGNTRREMDEKRAEYFACGAEAVWIVFPKSKTVEVATGPDAVRTLGENDILTGDPVLPGFRVKVAELFEVGKLGEGPSRAAATDDGASIQGFYRSSFGRVSVVPISDRTVRYTEDTPLRPLSGEMQLWLQDLHRLAFRPLWWLGQRDAAMADLLGKIGRTGKLAALPYLVRYLIYGSETVRHAAAAGVRDILAGQSDESLVHLEWRFVAWFRCDWYWRPEFESWNNLKPRDVNRLAADPSSCTSVLGLLSFHRSDYVRETAVRLLRKSRDGSELPFLLIRLHDCVEPVADLAYLAVTERLRVDYLPHFAAHLPLVVRLLRLGRSDSSDITGQVVTLLARPPFDPVLVEAMLSPDRAVRRGVVRVVLGHLDTQWNSSRAEPELLDNDSGAHDGHSHHDVKCRVVAHGLDSGDVVIRLWCVRHIQDCFSGDQLRDALDRLKHDRSMLVRREALRIEAAAYPRLELEIWKAALLDSSLAIRELARFRLRDLGECDSATVYREALNGNPDSLPALAGLGESGDSSDLPALRSYLTDPRPRRRAAALQGIARIAADNATDELIEALRDSSCRVVRMAARLLRERLYAMDLSRLYAVVRQTQDWYFQCIVLQLIFKAGKWRSLPWLIRASDQCDRPNQPMSHCAEGLVKSWLYSDRVFTRPSEAERREIYAALDELPEAIAVRFRNQLERVQI